MIKVMALNKQHEDWFSCKIGELERKGCLVLMRYLENWSYFSEKDKVIYFVQYGKF